MSYIGVDEMREVYPGPDTVEEMFSKYVFDVACSQEEKIKQQLIKLGWAPPDQVKEMRSINEGKDALLLDLATDVSELEAENRRLRAERDRCQADVGRLEDEIERYEEIVNQNNRSISLLYKQISEERRERSHGFE